jgi:hypothetical protein
VLNPSYDIKKITSVMGIVSHNTINNSQQYHSFNHNSKNIRPEVMPPTILSDHQAYTENIISGILSSNINQPMTNMRPQTSA